MPKQVRITKYLLNAKNIKPYIKKKSRKRTFIRPETKAQFVWTTKKKYSLKGPETKLTNEKWSRPIPPALNPVKDVLIFQQHDIDSYSDIPLESYGDKTFDTPNSLTSLLRMYGVTMEGYSVCCHVHGFNPYFFVSIPKEFNEDTCLKLKNALNEALFNDKISNKSNIEKPILDVALVKSKSLIYYSGDELITFARITVALPGFVAASRKHIERGHHKFFLKKPTMYYESNIEFNMKFMIDRGIVGCSWIELPAGKWRLRSKDDGNLLPMSRCQIEVDVIWDEFIAHKVDGEWGKIPPMRILSFDIECANRQGVFPTPDMDPVIQIANVVTHQGESSPFLRNIFTVNTCDPIVGAQVFSFETEEEMLAKWAEFVREIDPDIITGYNINNFDFPFLLDRARHLKVKNVKFLGRLKNFPSLIRAEIPDGNLVGQREKKKIIVQGRVIFDMINILIRDFKLPSYTLNAVSYHFLKEQKEDVHHSIITKLQNGTNETRRRLAMYCLKDAYLPIRLLNKLMSLISYMEMARVTGVPLPYLLNRGQQIKVVSQLLRKAKEAGFLMPTKSDNDIDNYEGATVFEPKKGFYNTPITILDFASLYPSIMMAHNLCYTTLLKPDCKEKYDILDEDITKTPFGSLFVKSSVRRGLLPEILESLLSARKKAKTELHVETDPFKRSILDARQVALKMSGNSVYGFTGAKNGRLPCLDISASVTAYGRVMISSMKKEIEQMYTRANGYEEDASVIYGDTDSVMIKFGMESLEKTMKLGREAAKHISNKFTCPIKLEFENVYLPYLLISKKRYAGLYYTKPDKYDKMDCKGIEIRRRDCSPLLRDLMETCLRKILIDRDSMGAIEYARKIISDLLSNRIDISRLIITKELSRTEYRRNPVHADLAKKMMQRDPGTAPKLGDRIPYVLTICHNLNQTTNAEDPLYAMQNNIPLDFKYYLKHVTQPLCRLFEPIYGDRAMKMLLQGSCTSSKSLERSKVNPLNAFLVKAERCIGCKVALLNNESEAICNHCVKDKAQILGNEIMKLQTLEDKFSRLWTQCQRCQGSLHEEVLCTNCNCPIFYMRKRIGFELDAQEKKITKFGDLTW